MGLRVHNLCAVAKSILWRWFCVDGSMILSSTCSAERSEDGNGKQVVQ